MYPLNIVSSIIPATIAANIENNFNVLKVNEYSLNSGI